MVDNSNIPTVQSICLQTRKWYIFLSTSLVVFFGGIILIVLYRLICWLCRLAKNLFLGFPRSDTNKTTSLVGRNEPERVGCTTAAKEWAGSIISGQTKIGQILVIFVFLVSISSLLIYLVDTYRYTIEYCDLWSNNIAWQVDFSFNIIFLVYFVIQFLAAPDKLYFWIEIYSIVDFFTIPPSFVAIYLNRNWLGLRFLRVLRIMSIPDVLQFVHVLQSTTTIRLLQLVFTLFSVWFTGAGFFYLLENSGDPFYDYSNGQQLTFWQCIYFTVVTMSTVGYGDITCKTILGQIFNVIFLLGALAMFASFVPEIAEILGQRSRFRVFYKRDSGKRHIVLCGNITAESVANFASDFFHVERDHAGVDVVIMSKKEPDLEMQGLLKCHFTQLYYIQGSIMHLDDLKRVELRLADSCLILANKYCSDVDAEDAANIMRVISVKNNMPELKVIVQLLQFHSKTYLMNIPNWDWERGDDAICLAELKLGFVAQSCLAPGFSTLMANLFTMRSFVKEEKNCDSWQYIYKRGSGMEMYSVYLSPSFTGMSFPEVAEICFKELRILLIAIETTREGSEDHYIAINPGLSVFVEEKTIGFFIAQDSNDVRIASTYCRNCLAGTFDEEGCCSKICLANRFLKVPEKRRCICEPERSLEIQAMKKKSSLSHIKSLNFNVEQTETGTCKFDTTGMFHWCEDLPFMSCILTEKNTENLCNHVVMCLFGDGSSPLIGLQNFVMPLRASHFHFDELRPIVILGEADYLKKEWKLLCNYPQLFMIFGSPLDRRLLRKAKIDLCESCVILSARKNFAEDIHLIDKENILCSLNIQAMLSPKYRSKLTKHTEMDSMSVLRRLILPSKPNIHIITELDNDTNIQFLEQEDEDNENELYLTQPFACGTAFTVSVLDSLMSTAFFSNNSLTLIRTLITGGSTPQLEEILAEGMTLECGKTTPETLVNRERCRVAQFAIDTPVFRNFVNNSYEDLFIYALRTYGTLIIGLYRFIDADRVDCTKRYVITNPPNNFKLFITDKFFCLCPGNKFPNAFETKRSTLRRDSPHKPVAKEEI